MIENARENLMNKVLCSDDLVLMNKSREFERNAFDMERGV